MLFRRFGILFCFLPALAKADLAVVGYGNPGLIQADHKGLYDKILVALFKDSGEKVSYKVMAATEAEKLFVNKEVDCVFPLDKIAAKVDFVVSQPLNHSKLYIYTRAGEGTMKSLNELKGKKIGMKAGATHGARWEAAKLPAEAVADDETNLRNLQAKKIDAFLAFGTEISAQLSKKKMATLAYDVTAPLEVRKDSLLCAKSAKVDSFLKKFNASLGAMKKSGWVQKQLGDLYSE